MYLKILSSPFSAAIRQMKGANGIVIEQAGQFSPLNPSLFMNKLFFSLILFFAFTLSAHAQINKGNWLLGGEISGGSANQKDTKADTLFSKYSGITLTPRIGWFVGNNWVIGVAPSYSGSSYESSGVNGQIYHSTSFSIAPFVRYYKSIHEKWAIITEFSGISLTTSSNNRENINTRQKDESSFNGYQIGLYVRPGITYFLSPKVGIEASLGSIGFGYTRNNRTTKLSGVTTELEDSSSSFNGSISLSSLVQNMSIGLHIYLP